MRSIEYILSQWEYMTKQQLHARLIERGSNFRQFAAAHGYNPRTVTQVVVRWVGRDELPNGRLSYAVLRDLSTFVGEPVSPALSRESLV